MTKFYADVDNRRAVERLAAIDPRLRAGLLDAMAVFKDRLVADARARAPVRTGAYLASIKGVVYGSKIGVIGQVKAGSHEAWYAHILEYGAVLPAHDIVDASGVMHFEDGAAEMFAKHVRFPGGRIAEKDILTGPFKAMSGEIRASIESVATAAAKTP